MDESLPAVAAAAYLGVSRATLYAYVSRGLVVSEPGPGRERRYPRWALDELKERRVDPVGGALQFGTPLLESAISTIDGGRLWYRGIDARSLSRTATLEQVAGLLWTGAPDGAAGLFPRSSRQAGRRGSFADRLVAALVAERARQPLTLADPSRATLRAAARTVSALFDAAGAAGRGSLAERLARGWRTAGVDDLQAALVLCADHELNASAFTARCVASTDAPLPNVLLAALAALEGRRHGGVGLALEDLLDDVERLGPRRALDRAAERSGRLPGFLGTHRLYPDGDPRALELLARLDLPRRDPLARAVGYAERLGGSPTVEVALAIFARRAGLPRGAAFAVFALGRSVGWVAHALEGAAGPLIRPRARYTGPAPGSSTILPSLPPAAKRS